MKNRTHPFHRFRGPEAGRGAIVVQVAILLVALLGFVALATEVGTLLYIKRQMQSAADAAAYSGELALILGYPGNFKEEPYQIAAAAGFVNGEDDTVVDPHTPPAIGNYAGITNAVEVVISKPQRMGLISVFYPAPIMVSARAVAIKDTISVCVLGLDPTAAETVELANVAGVGPCAVASNSNAAGSLYLNQNATISGPVNVVGTAFLDNGAAITGARREYAPPIADPYAGTSWPTPPANCTGTFTFGNNQGTEPGPAPGTCLAWSIGNYDTINLQPGTYYLASMTLGNNVTINGTGGVTLVVVGDWGLKIWNNAVFNITAPATGPYAGIALMGLSLNTAITQSIGRNASIVDIEGAVYFPHQTVDFANVSSAVASCTQILGRIVQLGNNVYINANPSPSCHTKELSFSVPKLVE